MIRIITAAALLIAGIWSATVAQTDTIGDQVHLDAIHGNYFSSMHTDSEWLSEGHRTENKK
jgi:hypothetical protein